MTTSCCLFEAAVLPDFTIFAPQKPGNVLSCGFDIKVQAFKFIVVSRIFISWIWLDDELCKSENSTACIITGREMNKTCSVTIYIEKEKITKPDPPLRGSDWASPRGPEDRLGLEYRSHLDTFCTRTSDANTRFDENILSRRVVARRCRYHPCKKTFSLFSLGGRNIFTDRNSLFRYIE